MGNSGMTINSRTVSPQKTTARRSLKRYVPKVNAIYSLFDNIVTTVQMIREGKPRFLIFSW